jgi:hypothetical protein
VKTWLLRLAGALLLALVFWSYLRPDFALDLASRFFLCS